MKHVQDCLGTRKSRESSFHHCGSPVKLVQACLNAGKVCFNRRGSAMNHVQACLSATKDLASSFNHCGGPVKLVQACLCAVKT